MKKFISILLTAAMLLTFAPFALAEGEITAEEVKALIEENLLSNQPYCEEILNLPVYNEDNIFEKKTLRDYIQNPEMVIVEANDIPYTNDIELPKTAEDVNELDELTEDGKMYSYYISRAYTVGNAMYIGDDEMPLNARLSYVYDTTEKTYPTMYFNYEQTAVLINSYNLKNVTSIRFAWSGMRVTADGIQYIVNTRWCKTPEQLDKENEESSKEWNEDQKQLLEQKIALTPPEYMKYIHTYDENGGYHFTDTEDTDSLSKYQGLPPVFSDLGDDEFLAQATHLLKDRGIIEGYDDETFRPDSTITRAEAAVIIAKLVKGDYSGGNEFPDVQNHWARDAVNYLSSAYVVHGYDDGLFRPDEKITYSEAAELVYSIMGFKANFYDDDPLYTMMYRGFFDGLDSFTNDTPISRGDFAKLVANAFDIALMTDTASFNGSYPTYSWSSDITLASYLDGKEPVNGAFFVSYEGYKAWEDEMTAVFNEIYKDILN